MRATAHIHYPLIVSFYLGSIVMLSSCGQTGPLYLPSDSQEASSKQIVDPDTTQKKSTSITTSKEKAGEKSSVIDDAD